MINFLGNITFLNPWILAGLGALPVLWFLLKITPPAPKVSALPTMRFLMGLEVKEQTPSHTPLWLLLLRMLLAALVIVALARPIHNPAGQLPSANTIQIVMDNGWEAAQTWSEQTRAAQEILDRAGREKKELYILTTAPQPGQDKPLIEGPLNFGAADGILKGLEPLPWPSDYKATAETLAEQKFSKSAYTYWFGTGLSGNDFNDLSKAALSKGGVTYITPAPEKLPLLLKQADHTGIEFKAKLLLPKSTTVGRETTVQATTQNGQVIDQQTAIFAEDKKPLEITFDVPESLRNDVAQYRLAGQNGVGGVFILDEQYQKRNVGLVNPAGEENVKPFIEARFYIQRALEPYANLKQGTIDILLEEDLSVLILPDIGALPASTLDRLEEWVKDGGMLLRFAGPIMADTPSQTFLTPVPLRQGGRSLEGSLTWQNPPKLVEFPEGSPFYGIDVPEEIVVKQQILADPIENLDEKTWAQLDDETPFITADTLDQGLLVLVHTSASPDWSDLPLSGVFVDILRRLVRISGRSNAAAASSGFLQPIWVFDGLARIQTPGGAVQPIEANAFDTNPVSAIHPPGLYGQGGLQRALNLGGSVDMLHTPQNMPENISQQIYGDDYEQDLLPYLLYGALLILLLDWAIMLIMALGGVWFARFAAIALLFIFLPITAQAQTSEEELAAAQKYSDGLYLAFMTSGNIAIDQEVQKGLENLNAVLSRRTSVEPAGVAQLNPEHDQLTFFPIIYWPVTGQPLDLSNKALSNVQKYLDQGGTILFDTRDQKQSAARVRETANAAALRQMIGNLNIPPLAPMEKTHVLSRSFYLLESFPGRYTDGPIWIETQSANNRDGVSSVVIGGHDWAGAWASVKTSSSGAIRPATRQEELALRTGVNFIMYALTGNYKADQVHVPHILERLGQ